MAVLSYIKKSAFEHLDYQQIVGAAYAPAHLTGIFEIYNINYISKNFKEIKMGFKKKKLF